MIKTILCALAILAAIAPLTTAEKIKCNNATAYCGATLINRGGYLTQISEILKNHDEDAGGLLLQHGLFWCKEDGKLHDAYKKCKRNKCRANQGYYPESGDECKGEWRGSILPDMK